MKKIFFIFLVLFILSCTTEKKVEENLKKFKKEEFIIKFKHSANGLERRGLWRENLCIEDINADGNLDIIAPPPRGEGMPVFFLGDGNGNWNEWKEVYLPNLPYSYGGIDVKDIDQNGLPDLAIACHNGRIYVLLQSELGVFEDFSKGLPDPTKFSSRVVKFADFDNDGKFEIVTLNESPSYPGSFKINPTRQKVFKLIGDKWEEIKIEIKNNVIPCFGNNIELADFNNDGKLDFATSCNHYSNKYLLFLYEENKFFGLNIESLPSSSYFFGIASSDLNKDGNVDLVFAATTFNKTEETEEKPELAMTSSILIAFNFLNEWKVEEIIKRNAGIDKIKFTVVALGDLNNDGYDDIFSILEDGNPYLFINENGRKFTKAEFSGFIKRGKPSWIGIKDLNKDGKNDVVVAYGFEEEEGIIDVYLSQN